MFSDKEDTEQSRRNVLQAAGGALGVSLFASRAVTGVADTMHKKNNADAHQPQQQQEHGERVAMSTVAWQEGEALEFRSPLIWVDSGATVTWVLESGHHSTTAYAPENDKPRRIPKSAQAWDSGIISQQGKTFTHTFDVEGVYDYYCIPHESVGMLGRVVVGTPNLETQPALEPPQQSLPPSAKDLIGALNTLTRTMFRIEQHEHDH